MPNHVTTVLVSTPEVVATLYRETTAQERAQHDLDQMETRNRVAARAAEYRARGEAVPAYFEEREPDPAPERVVDFANVVEQPASMFHGGCNGQHPHPRPEEEGGGYYEHCWYEWQIEAWGTKWNGYSASYQPAAGDLVELRFDTAWAHPFPVVAALAERHHGEPIYVAYVDEDLGANLGAYVVVGGAGISDGVGAPLADAVPLCAEQGDGILDDEVLEVLSREHRVDVQRCQNMAAPPDYRHDADRASLWAGRLKYGEDFTLDGDDD